MGKNKGLVKQDDPSANADNAFHVHGLERMEGEELSRPQ